jgi:phosphopantothenoylcysteine decarboxylase/phosphopantothenate--cysteine ligase
MTRNSKFTIVLGITGSISAYRACDLILDLKESGVRVLPVLTRDAQHFVTPLAIQSLAGEAAQTDLMRVDGNLKPIHIELARQADLIVVCPASADILARMRMGLTDDLLSCTLLAAQSPVIVVPAMNDKMYEHPATQENLKVLRDRGVRVIDPIEGKLVCSDHAMGHIQANDVILKEILRILSERPARTQ